MKLILAFLALLALTAGTSLTARHRPVTLDNMQAEYKSLAEVKPVLVNSGDRAIFLLQKECGEVDLTYIEQEYWSFSDPRPCPDYAPIEIEPGRRYSPPSPIMRGDLGDGNFYEDKQGQAGRYRMTISYSFTPSYQDGKPELAHKLVKEFRIVR
jgi:hypothetical protein